MNQTIVIAMLVLAGCGARTGLLVNGPGGPVLPGDAGPDAQPIPTDSGPTGSDTGAGGWSCWPLNTEVHPECREMSFTPVIGVDRFCPSDNSWIPTLGDADVFNTPTGREPREFAYEQCLRWASCVGIGAPCWHCIEAGFEWNAWEEILEC